MSESAIRRRDPNVICCEITVWAYISALIFFRFEDAVMI